MRHDIYNFFNRIMKSSSRIIVVFTIFSILLNSSVSIVSSNNSEYQVNFDAITKRIDLLTENNDFDASSIIVKYKEGSQASSVSDKFNNMGWGVISINEEIMQSSASGNKDKRKIAESKEEKDAIKNKLAEYLSNPEVLYAQPNYIYKYSSWSVDDTTAVPSDYDAIVNWYYEQANLPEMWKQQGCPSGTQCGGKSDVIVAVIDSGLALENYYDGYNDVDFYQSPEITDSILYTNPNEIPDNGYDDDCNGAVDDVHGFDAYAYGSSSSIDRQTCSSYTGNPWYYSLYSLMRKSGHPVDTGGHGSYVASMISAPLENGSGVAVNLKVKIMPISANLYFQDAFYSSDIGMGIYYAEMSGADIINMSLAGESLNDQYLKDAIDFVTSNGVVVVAASGNENSLVSYPAAFSNVISVGSVNTTNLKSNYSNYGSNLDLVAYVGDYTGDNPAVFQSSNTCFFDGNCSSLTDYYSFSIGPSVGTSFAAPQVSAAVAVLKSVFPELTTDKIREILSYATDDIGASGWDSETGYGVLNWEKLWNSPPLRYGSKWITDAGNSGDGFYVGDFTGDGRDDIAISRVINSTTVKWWISKSTGRSFSAPVTWIADAGNNGDNFYVGDFTGDGRDDIAISRVINSTTVKWWVVRSTGGNFASPSTWSSDFGNNGDDWFVGLGNADNKNDVFLKRQYTSNTARLYASNSSGSSFLSANILLTDFSNNTDVNYIGDFNGNGKSDFLTSRIINPTTVTWFVDVN